VSVPPGLRRSAATDAPTDPLHLLPTRVHEAQGPGRRVFGLAQGARSKGAVVWILPAHAPEQPMLWGLPPGLVPRLHIVRARGEVDLLWATEEALRSADVAAVLAEPDKPLNLPAGRRLQLAAEAGRTLGLMLIRADQGSNATETRWHCSPQPGPGLPGDADSTLHQWSLIKNKKGTLGDWVVNWNGASSAFHLVSAAGKRPYLADPPL
jgi:protein ImuA